MKYVFLTLMGVVLCMTFLCRNYGKDIVKKLDVKQHPLKIFYGFSMFLLDKCIWKIVVKFQKNIADKMRALMVKDEVNEAMYIYSLKKVSICVAISFLIMFVGLCVCITNEQQNEVIVTLERPAAETKTVYGMEAVVDNESSENIDIVVEGRQYTKEEINELLENSYEEVLGEMLGENDSQDHINQKLNLISSLSNGVKISWSIDNTDIINYDGELGEDIDAEGEIVNINAVLSYKEQKIEYEIVCCVYPKEESEKSIQEKVQDIVDLQSDSGRNVVALPSEIDGEEISFYSMDKQSSVAFLILALIIPIVIFVIKDRELETKIQKRNIQMLCDYPEIVGKLQLLIAAGMTVNNAWSQVVADYQKKITKKDGTVNEKKVRFAYEEMKLALNRMNSGISEIECYNHFGSRCKLHPYLKLSSILCQNVKRGTKGINKMLEAEVQDTFEQKKNLAKKLGEEASTKLLVPMIMMLVVTIVLIVFPALNSVNF